MDDQELKDYQDPESWEHSSDDKRGPAKSGRAVVSVAFSRQDFELVADAAAAEHVRTSEFIRDAALERAHEQSKRATIVSATGHLQVLTPYPRPALGVAPGVRAESESKALSAETHILSHV